MPIASLERVILQLKIESYLHNLVLSECPRRAGVCVLDQTFVPENEALGYE